MKNRRILGIIFGVIALAINVLIIVESCIGGEGSGSQSLGFTNFIVSIIEKVVPNASILEDQEHLHSVIRKLFGHFLLFGLSGIFTTLSALFFNSVDEKKRNIILLSSSFGFGLLLATISEIIQYFIPGRAGVPTDVIIDFTGYFLFATITFGIYYLIYYNINLRQEKEGE